MAHPELLLDQHQSQTEVRPRQQRPRGRGPGRRVRGGRREAGGPRAVRRPRTGSGVGRGRRLRRAAARLQLAREQLPLSAANPTSANVTDRASARTANSRSSLSKPPAARARPSTVRAAAYASSLTCPPDSQHGKPVTGVEAAPPHRGRNPGARPAQSRPACRASRRAQRHRAHPRREPAPRTPGRHRSPRPRPPAPESSTRT